MSGKFWIAAQPVPDDPENAVQARAMIETFVRAFDLGFFDDAPERQAEIVPGSIQWSSERDSLFVRFGARSLPRSSFAVLAGMKVGYAEHLGTRIASLSAGTEGYPDLLSDPPSFQLSRLSTLPFTATIPEEGSNYKSLRIWVDFAGQVDDEARARLQNLFATWDGLVLGPFPAKGRVFGDSWAGPSTTSWLLPDRVEHAFEDFESGYSAFDVLLRALLRFHRRIPIDCLEIE